MTDLFYKRAKLDPKKSYTKVGDKAMAEGSEVGNEINAIIKEMKEELAAEFEVKTEEQVEKEEIIEEAQEVVKQAEVVGVENLKTEEEVKTRRNNYNLVNNEGGEGYAPNKISFERYQRASKVLGVEVPNRKGPEERNDGWLTKER